MNKVRRALRSKTATDSSWGLGDQAAVLVTTTLSALLLTRRLGAGAYGAYAGTYAVVAPFLAFVQSGVSLAVMDRIVRERGEPRAVTNAYLGYVAVGSVVLWVVVSALVSLLIKGMPVVAAVLFIGSDVVVLGALGVTTAAIQATVGYKFAAQVRIMAVLTKGLVLVVLAVVGHLSLVPLAVTQISASLVLAVFVHRWHQRLLGGPLRPQRFKFAEVKSSAVYAVGLSAIATQNSYDQVVLKSSLPAVDPIPGRYAAGYRIVSLGMMPLAAIANATHTDFLNVHDGRNDQVGRAVKLSKVALVYSVVFCTAMIIFAPVVPKIFGADFEGTEKMMRLLAPLVPLRGIAAFPLNGLLGLDRNPLRTKILFVNAVFSLALYIALIPPMGYQGAILATVLCEVTLFLAAWAALFKCQAEHDRQHEVPAGVG